MGASILVYPAVSQELELTDVTIPNGFSGVLFEGISIEEETMVPVPESVLCNGLEIVNPGFGFGAQDFNLTCAQTTILQNKGLDPNAYEQTTVQQDAPEAQQIASLRALDKITGRFTDFDLKVGEETRFETLTIQVAACFKNPETETPESAAYLHIDDGLSGRAKRLFSGWMYASSPSLSAMESPIYDVWVVACKN